MQNRSGHYTDWHSRPNPRMSAIEHVKPSPNISLCQCNRYRAPKCPRVWKYQCDKVFSVNEVCDKVFGVNEVCKNFVRLSTCFILYLCSSKMGMSENERVRKWLARFLSGAKTVLAQKRPGTGHGCRW